MKNKIVRNTTNIGLILSYFIAITLIGSCNLEKKDVLCNPKAAYRISIIDKDSVSILGLNKIYNPDNVYYEINNIKTKAITSSDYIYLPLGFDTLNEKAFNIVLNSPDKDAIKLKIENGTNECGKYTEILEFYYNTKLINERNRIYEIVK